MKERRMKRLQSGTESRARTSTRRMAARSGLSLALSLTLVLIGVVMISPTAAARVTADAHSLASDIGVAEAGAERIFSDATSSWSNFQPTDWVTSTTPVCTVTVVDSEGLQQSTARYRYSTNGGSAWSGWSTSGLAISGDLDTTKYFTVTGATFLESAAQNQIQFYILDLGGLTDTSPIYTVKVDASAPAAPTALTATPTGWTGVNSFDLTWTNPADVSGVAGAYYKLDSAPVSATDGAYVPGNNIQSISDISVSGEGEHPVYVWLQDAAGNRDHTHRATVTLHYDNTAPASPIDLAATPATWTNVNSFDLSWTNPAGAAPIAGAYYKLDSAPVSPSDGGFIAGADIQKLDDVAVAGAGAHDAYIWLRDEAGNADHTHRAHTTLYYDAQVPTGPTVFTSTSHVVATWASDNTIDVQWSGAADAHSDIGGYALLWDRNPTTMPAPVTTTAAISAVSPALASGNDHYAHLRTVDNAGNWTAGAWHLGPFYIQTSAPGAPLNLTATPASWAHTNTFDLTWQNPDTVAGIAGAYYKLDSPPLFETDGTWVAGDDIDLLEDIAVSGDGIHPVYVWLKDHAGNVSVSNRSSTDLHLDTFRPGAPTNLSPDPVGWSNNAQFGISWTNPWDLSGISGAFYKLDAEPVSSDDGVWVTTTNTITDVIITQEGEHDIYLWLRDTAGNSDYRTRNILLNAFKYDATAPTTTLQADGVLGQAGWYTTPVDIMLQAADNLSTVDETWHRIDAGDWLSATAFSLNTSGAYTVSYYSEDVAGNAEDVQTEQMYLDWLAPTTAMSIDGALGDGGWYTSAVQVTLTPFDSVSDIALTRHRVDGGAWLTGLTFPLETDGIHQVDFYSVDNAGNREDVQSEALLVDAGPPITLHSIAGTAGQADWYRSPVTVTLMPTDLASGPAATYYRVDSGSWISGTQFTVSQEGMHTAQFYTRDYAGNVEDVHSLAVNVDTVSPSPPFGLASNPLGWTSTNSFTITWNSLADASGIAGAWHKLNAEPTGNTDGAYQAGASGMISGVQAPAEGKHTVYLWLQDGAGNVNYQTRNVLNQALWYDATPPTTTVQLTGALGQNGWYTSVVGVNLTGEDARSGVDRYYHRLLGGEWVEGQSFQVTTPGRHTVQYYAVDGAGNAETPQSTFVKVDLDPPASPIGLRAGQTGWQDIDAFSVTWTDPIDTSLIGAAYYRLDAPPAFATDGQMVSAPLGEIDDIGVSADGKHSIYVWLVDNAGNLDHTHYASVIDAFWYDSRPPTTTHTISGTLGLGSWYRSPVTVTLSAVDLGSGPAATVYRVGSQTWKTGSSFHIDTDGQHVVQYYSTDAAGNSESLHTVTVKIDTQKPSSQVSAPFGYQEGNVVTVEWSGTDPQPGSGILYYDVQYRDGKNGAWVPWRTATDQVSDVFVGQRGHIYYFRSRASDLAGNVEVFPAGYGDRQIYIEPIVNGRFETQSLSGWTASGALNRKVQSLSAHGGGSSYMAVLGNPELGPCYDTLPPVLPSGSAVISQTVSVPGTPDVVVPTLRFWYHIMTYDTVWSERYQRYYDSFDVELSVAGSSARQLLLRDGNYDPNKVGSGKPVTDLGWREAEIDLSDYAGQTVTLYFTVSNRVDQYFNTWAYLDDVSIIDTHTGAIKVYIPLSTRSLSGAAMNQQRMDRVTSGAGVDLPR
jgi:hypothetical protein